jgi:hypothetical protein
MGFEQHKENAMATTSTTGSGSSRRMPRPPGQAAAAVRDARGGVRLLLDLVKHGLDRAEAFNERVVSVDPAPVNGELRRPARTVARTAYRVLRGGTDVAGGALDLLLASLQASLLQPQLDRAPAPPSPAREAVVDALNALAGDHLHRTDNPLAVHTRLRVRDHAAPQPRVVVLAHDLGLGELSWRQRGHDHGEALAAALGATAIYAHYNSGRHVAAVARELSAELEPMLSRWRVPLLGVDLVGHGLGGLVLRAALHQATRSGMAWPGHVRHVVFLGTPHHGAQEAGLKDLLGRLRSPAAAVLPLAGLARRRSEGIADFLEGRVLEDDARTGLTPLANAIAGVPASLPTYAIAGEVAGMNGDGLVGVDSALGRHEAPARDLLLPEDHRWVATGTDHLGLLGSEAVFQRMKQWLSA